MSDISQRGCEGRTEDQVNFYGLLKLQNSSKFNGIITCSRRQNPVYQQLSKKPNVESNWRARNKNSAASHMVVEREPSAKWEQLDGVES